jgi:LuxR family maltose regulon positive regulatory protein
VLGPLLNSKYRPPALRPGTVRRRRLAYGLRDRPPSTLTVLSAPAGFGKTTLLTEWLAADRADPVAVAWLSLDARDNDPVLFWTYVVTALQSAVAGIGAAALQLLASSSGVEAAVAAVLNDGPRCGPRRLSTTSGRAAHLSTGGPPYHVRRRVFSRCMCDSFAGLRTA